MNRQAWRHFLWAEGVHQVRASVRAPRDAVASLAISAITAAVAAYTTLVVNEGILNPFPYRDFDRLLEITLVDPENQVRRNYFSAAELREIASSASLGSGLWASDLSRVPVRIGAVSVRASISRMNTSAVDRFGIRLIAGASASLRQGSTALVSQSLAKRVSPMALSVVGEGILIGGKQFTVAAVFDDRYAWRGADVIVPTELATEAQGLYFFTALVPPTVKVDAAGLQTTIIRALREAGTRVSAGARVVTQPLAETLAPGAAQALGSLLALGMVTLAACVAAVYGVVAVVETKRQHATAIAAALGMSEGHHAAGRIAFWGATAAAGSGVGVCATVVVGPAALALLPSGFVPRGALQAIGLARAVLIGAACVVVSVAAFYLQRSYPAQAIAQRTHDGARTASRSMRGLAAGVVLQSLFATLALGVAIAQVRALWHTQELVDALGTPDAYVVDLDGSDKETYKERTLRVEEGLQALGIRAKVVAVHGLHPLGGPVTKAIQVEDAAQTPRNVVLFSTEPGYFELRGVRPSAGRLYDERDDRLASAVAVVSESVAAELRNGRSAYDLGSLRLPELAAFAPKLRERTLQIVGVVPDAKTLECQERCPAVYVPAGTTGLVSSILVAPMEAASLDQVQKALEKTTDAALSIETLKARVRARTVDPVMARRNLSIVVAALASFIALAGVATSGYLAFTTMLRECLVRVALGCQLRAVALTAVWSSIRGAVGGAALGAATGSTMTAIVASRMAVVTTPMDYVYAGAALSAAAAVACVPLVHQAITVSPAELTRFD